MRRRVNTDAKVYPRVCGGTPTPPPLGSMGQGLSPRVRGNLSSPNCRPATQRSIPACAGEPNQRLEGAAIQRVYPRVCGGTSFTLTGSIPTIGLSPRVRGNPDGVVCGAQYSKEGLSPRVRGNRALGATLSPPGGSIPACAGEPSRVFPCYLLVTVYPRVCGGTASTSLDDTGQRGLSPRVRGNQCLDPRQQVSQGSIPACAGEPPVRCVMPDITRVYPRVCGGTGLAWAAFDADWVYPRVCGGT